VNDDTHNNFSPWKLPLRAREEVGREAALSRLGERDVSYAASALAGFSGGVIAPETLISATSLSV